MTTAERTARSPRWAAVSARRRQRAVQESSGTTARAEATTATVDAPAIAAATPAATAWPP
ncbi:hypothetical protein GCM10010348_45590 [Streptomyces anthocyanicus]|nr:hypothetical protein GCM10010348_45590 [Streptomyces anthocyanicus]